MVLFRERLKELRLENGLSQQKLANELGFCNQTISFWETGSREPDLDTLLKIANYFEISVGELLQDKE